MQRGLVRGVLYMFSSLKPNELRPQNKENMPVVATYNVLANLPKYAHIKSQRDNNITHPVCIH